MMNDVPHPDVSESYSFEAIGTGWQIDTARPLTDSCKREIATHIDAYDLAFSRFRADSVVSQASRTAGGYLLPAYAQELFALYDNLFVLTGGAFTPLVGQILDELGYDATYSLRRKSTPSPPPAWSEVAKYERGVLFISQPLLIDVGAAGKGHLVDLICAVLETEGHMQYTVDAGGDIRMRSPSEKALRVGLEHPDNTNLVIGTVDILNQSICASATNRRNWGAGLHHVINPHTALPTTDISATWVVAESTMVADALATCLFLVPPEVLGRDYEFEFLRISCDWRLEKSANFPATLFS